MPVLSKVMVYSLPKKWWICWYASLTSIHANVFSPHTGIVRKLLGEPHELNYMINFSTSKKSSVKEWKMSIAQISMIWMRLTLYKIVSVWMGKVRCVSIVLINRCPSLLNKTNGLFSGPTKNFHSWNSSFCGTKMSTKHLHLRFIST